MRQKPNYRHLTIGAVIIAFGGLASSASAEFLTVERSAIGGIVLPDFDTALGSLLSVRLEIAIEGFTEINQGGDGENLHYHHFELLFEPFTILGRTNDGPGNESHKHFINVYWDMSFSAVAHLNQLFLTGSDVYLQMRIEHTFADLTDGHVHSIYPEQIRFNTTTTFDYLPQAVVPEPSTCALAFLGVF